MDENTIHIDPLESDLIGFINGECSPEESERIYALIKKDKAVKEKYTLLLDSLTKLDDAYLGSQFDAGKAKNAFFDKIGTTDEPEHTREVELSKPDLRWIKIAAAILVILVPSYFYLSQHQSKELLSGNDKIEEILLPDQSKVWLNTHSELQYSGGLFGTKRMAKLSGEAYFEIESNPQHPFIIHTPGVDVKVIGTAFNIRNYAADSVATISVTEGVVEVCNKQGKMLSRVIKGEQIQVAKYSEAWTVSHLPDENFQAWKTGVLKFRNTRLRDALPLIGSYYNIPIKLVEDSLGEKQITSTFKSDSLESVLEILSFMYNLSISNQDSVIYITASQK